MKTTFRAVAAVAILFSCRAFAAAQGFASNVGTPPGGYPGGGWSPLLPYAPYEMYNGYGYLPYDHASTYEEGLLRGQGALLRAYGQSNYWNAQAMKGTQEAYRQYLDNQKKTLQTYDDLARINQDARARERGPRLTGEDLRRYASEGVPKPLTASQFDGVFGVLRWPEVLRRPEFATERYSIDRLLPDYCLRRGDVGSDACCDLSRSIHALEGKLKQEINSLSPTDYVAAKKFLESLDCAVHRRTEITRLSAR
jgi:hypothetical protein